MKKIICNSTEGGAKIKGTTQLSLKEYIGIYCQDPIDKSKIKTLLSHADDADELIKKVIPLLQQDIDNLEEIIINARKGIAACHGLKVMVERKDYTKLFPRKKERMFDQINQKAIKESGGNKLLVNQIFFRIIIEKLPEGALKNIMMLSKKNFLFSESAHIAAIKNPLVNVAIYGASRQIASRKIKGDSSINSFLKNKSNALIRTDRNIIILKAAQNAAESLKKGYKETLKKLKKYNKTKNNDILVSPKTEPISLDEAEKILQEMIDSGFNVDEAQRLFNEAKVKIDSRRNKQAKDLADELIVLGERAFETDALIRRIMEVMTNPRKSRLLLKPGISGFVIEDYDVDNYFVNHPAAELVELSRVAFGRGDFELAKQRADSAKAMLLFSIKGNLWLAIILYWPFILLGGLILSVGGIVGVKKYKKSVVTRKIGSLNNKEANVRKLIGTSQEEYFAGKMSSSEYHRAIEQHQNKLSEIRKVRIGLRNRRIKMLKPREVIMDLKLERMQIEGEIKELQTDYYKAHKISEQEYKLQFEILNGRLAEIEDERTTLSLDRNRKLIKVRQKVAKKGVRKTGRFFKNFGRGVKGRDVGKNGKIDMFNFLGKYKERKRVKEEEGFRNRINEMFGGQQ